MGLCNTVKAALVSGVTRQTIYNWMRARKIRYVVRGGHRLILLDSLPRGAR